MSTREVSSAEYRALAEFRHQLRRFQRFSEDDARAAGLEPRQHQLLLAVRGAPPDAAVTIGTLAERLQLRHHSTVELVDRMESGGLVRRARHADDGRQVVVRLTPRGERLLQRLSVSHRTELRSVAPRLLDALAGLVPDVKRAPHAPRR